LKNLKDSDLIGRNIIEYEIEFDDISDKVHEKEVRTALLMI
jgi:hypothetical protein